MEPGMKPPGSHRFCLLLTAALLGCSSDPSAVELREVEIVPHVSRVATFGKEVTFALEVQNLSEEEVVLTLPHREFSFDPIVRSPERAEVVWRRWNGVVAPWSLTTSSFPRVVPTPSRRHGIFETSMVESSILGSTTSSSAWLWLRF
jgi:hypothetical protein